MKKEKQHKAFGETLKKKFPNVADEIIGFVNNPKDLDPLLVKVKSGVKFGIPYYITQSMIQDPGTLHNSVPSFVTTEIAHILMNKTEYDLFDKKECIDGVQIQVIEPPEGHTHIMIAFGFHYHDNEKKPFSLMKKVREFARNIRKKMD